jgi:hypothetical protein
MPDIFIYLYDYQEILCTCNIVSELTLVNL